MTPEKNKPLPIRSEIDGYRPIRVEREVPIVRERPRTQADNFDYTRELQLIREEIESERRKQVSTAPKTFDEMLDTSKGNFFQKAAKAWIKPHNPEGTIKLLKFFQVDKFQEGVIKGWKWTYKNIFHRDVSNRQTNYTLADGSLNSLIDFATNQTSLNEAIHLFGMVQCASSFVPQLLINGHLDGSGIFCAGFFVINTYCVLAQRYARARIAMAIDRSMERGKPFSRWRYTNSLAIRVPGEERQTEFSERDY